MKKSVVLASLLLATVEVPLCSAVFAQGTNDPDIIEENKHHITPSELKAAISIFDKIVNKKVPGFKIEPTKSQGALDGRGVTIGLDTKVPMPPAFALFAFDAGEVVSGVIFTHPTGKISVIDFTGKPDLGMIAKTLKALSEDKDKKGLPVQMIALHGDDQDGTHDVEVFKIEDQ